VRSRPSHPHRGITKLAAHNPPNMTMRAIPANVKPTSWIQLATEACLASR
jgi:hypothetical protein